MDILLLGSGGREHAIAVALKASPLCDALYVAPGNGGTAAIATNIKLDINDPAAVADYAAEHGVGLVVIGPEAPLVAGVADAVRAKGIPAFGPGAQGAQMEGSKRFAKEFMERHGIPTAAYRSFTEQAGAEAYVAQRFAADVKVLVVKADGLAAGKGVVVATSEQEALGAVRDCFSGHFGEAGSTVVIEEGLTGPECSLLAFVDGSTVRLMATAQDHKRALEGDLGPNTGGMGVYSPVPIVTDEEYATMAAAMQTAADGLVADGIEYRGVLYGGFMLTPEGPKVLEFNARFGDPETQVILPRLKTDLVEVMLAVARSSSHGAMSGRSASSSQAPAIPAPIPRASRFRASSVPRLFPVSRSTMQARPSTSRAFCALPVAAFSMLRLWAPRSHRLASAPTRAATSSSLKARHCVAISAPVPFAAAAPGRIKAYGGLRRGCARIACRGQ